MKLTFSDIEGVNLEFGKDDDPELLGKLLFTITSGLFDKNLIEAVYQVAGHEAAIKVANVWDNLTLKAMGSDKLPLVRPLKRKRNGK